MKNATEYFGRVFLRIREINSIADVRGDSNYIMGTGKWLKFAEMDES